MNKPRSLRVLGIVGALLALGGLQTAQAEDVLRKAVIFGDSLSDPGNAYALTGAQAQRPFELIPSYPYAIGGHHLSNGRTWAERLGGRVITASSAGPAFRAPGVKTNYAVAATRARPGQGPLPEADLTFQVERYLADFGGNTKRRAIHILFVGGNDIRDALASLQSDPSGATSQAIVAEALGAIAENVQTLYLAGASEFILMNGPDISLTPAVQLLGPLVVGAAQQVVAGYNAGFMQTVDALEANLPGVMITRVDVAAGLNDIVANPDRYKLINTSEPCLRFNTVEQAICDHPNDYLFWDGIHPTRAGHGAVAKIIRRGAF